MLDRDRVIGIMNKMTADDFELDELCRAYLDLLDAPEARPLELQCKGFDDPDRERLNRMVKSGKRVRLVDVFDAD